jgi:hypothetical protein
VDGASAHGEPRRLSSGGHDRETSARPDGARRGRRRPRGPPGRTRDPRGPLHRPALTRGSPPCSAPPARVDPWHAPVERPARRPAPPPRALARPGRSPRSSSTRHPDAPLPEAPPRSSSPEVRPPPPAAALPRARHGLFAPLRLCAIIPASSSKDPRPSPPPGAARPHASSKSPFCPTSTWAWHMSSSPQEKGYAGPGSLHAPAAATATMSDRRRGAAWRSVGRATGGRGIWAPDGHLDHGAAGRRLSRRGRFGDLLCGDRLISCP